MYINKLSFIIFLFLNNCFLFAQINFEDVALSKGVNVVTGDVVFGSGVSFFDFNNDGWDDLSFATKHNQELEFYQNFNGQFIKISLGVGLIDTNHHAKQINWVDLDNDGDSDLFITSTRIGTGSTDLGYYRNRLFENTGNLNFTEITQQAGLPMQTLGSYGASWGDYNSDGFLDVFICNRDENSRNFLYKNNGDGTFDDVSEIAGISLISHLSFASAWIDINNDGYQDLYISNDKIEQETFRNIMYKNNGDGTFTDISESSGTNILIDAMTVTVGDYNNDGWFDIYVTNLGRSTFLKNNGDETFTDVATETNTEFNSSAWCANFLDGDNDGKLDLYVSGSLSGFPQFLSGAFYHNNGSNVYNIPLDSGFEFEDGASYSNAIGDFNNDGLPDIIETNIEDANVFLWENNNIENNNWIKIDLEGVISNRDGIGSVIEVTADGKTQYHYTNSGESYLSQNSGTEFFGLGGATIIDQIKVKWLSGATNILKDVSVNQSIKILEDTQSLSIDTDTQLLISLYPNPVSNFLNIKTQECLQSIEILDLQGRLVVNLKADNCLINKVDISDLNSRIYFVRLNFDHKSVTKKIIKS